jgi:hypothetical protein
VQKRPEKPSHETSREAQGEGSGEGNRTLPATTDIHLTCENSSRDSTTWLA